MEKAFQQCVREVSDRGAGVLLSSHILAEVEQLCDTVTIIRSGRAVKSGTLENLRHLMRTTVKVRTRADINGLRNASFVHDLTTQDAVSTFSVDRNDLNAAMDKLTDLGIDELSVFPASLEDMFLREYQAVS
jgi:ABC-2 type transport system ATP-binding protein